MEELGREPVRPKLAISLNASTEEQRRELMPITRKYHLKDLMEACRAYPLRPWEKLTFEYVLLKGVNDTDADARRVVRLLAQSRLQGEPDRAESRPRHPVRDARSGARRVVPGDRAAVACRASSASRAAATSSPPADN